MASSTRSSTQCAPDLGSMAVPKRAHPGAARRTACPPSLISTDACARVGAKVPCSAGAASPGRWLKMAAVKPMLSFSLPLVMSAAKTLNWVTPSVAAASMIIWARASGSAVEATAPGSLAIASCCSGGATAESRCAYTEQSLSAGPKFATSLAPGDTRCT